MVDFISIFIDKTSILDINTLLASFMIIMCPITWNIVARYEFHTKFFTKLCKNNKVLAADVFAHILIEMGIFRNYMFNRAVSNNPTIQFSDNVELIISVFSYLLMFISFIIVAGSYWQLGIHGIYYADYFGILMDEKVTAFPYNILDNPLYVGAQMLFLSKALLNKSPTGIILFVLASIMYRVASYLEMPLTDLIYSEENRAKVQKENEIYKKIK